MVGLCAANIFQAKEEEEEEEEFYHTNFRLIHV